MTEGSLGNRKRGKDSLRGPGIKSEVCALSRPQGDWAFNGPEVGWGPGVSVSRTWGWERMRWIQNGRLKTGLDLEVIWSFCPVFWERFWGSMKHRFWIASFLGGRSSAVPWMRLLLKVYHSSGVRYFYIIFCVYYCVLVYIISCCWLLLQDPVLVPLHEPYSHLSIWISRPPFITHNIG